MDLAAVYHRPKDNFAYAVDTRTVHLRLRSKKGDVQRCSVVWGDKYAWSENQLQPMRLLGSDELFDYWQCEITPPYRRLAYAFVLEGDRDTVWFTERGFSRQTPPPERPVYFFEFPFVHAVDALQPPEWVNDAVFYEIFPDRFANGDRAKDRENLKPWGTLPGSGDFFGGDLQGVIQQLDYLEQLGVNALYFTPIFTAPSNHKYDTVDYLQIDPSFGDLQTLKDLVNLCHQRGIKVILDAVFNHAGYYFPPFQDVLKNGADSPYLDWFHIRSLPVVTDPVSYDCFAFVPEMPKLNTANPRLKEYLLGVARYWLEAVGVDGWRLDVANEVDHDFWRDFRREVKRVNPEAFILGEIWHDSLPWLQGDQFDSVMNYPFTEAVLDFFTRNKLDASQFAGLLIKNLFSYPERASAAMFNLLDSHDTPRLLRQCAEDKRVMQLAVLFQLTYPGAPCIYYGDEVGLTGGEDPDCRRTMEWDLERQDLELFDFYQRLIRLRKEHAALRRGKIAFVHAEPGGKQLAYRRETADAALLIVINNAATPAVIKVNIGKDKTDWQRLESTSGRSGVWSPERGNLTFALPAFGFMILQRES